MEKLALNPLFASGMVFQANKPMRIFGTGDGAVSVVLLDTVVKVHGKSGHWLAELPAMPYGGPYTLTILMENEEIILDDIWVGEVFIIAGQSNLQFKLQDSTTPREEWKDIPQMRLFSSPRLEEGEFFHPSDGWVTCTKENAGYWSAVGYHVGEILQRELGVAVGVITSYQGASVIDTWVPEGLFEQNGISLTKEEKTNSHYCPEYSAWNREGTLYHYVVERLMPYSVGHVVWYQGESDSTLTEAKVYDQELALLINFWPKGYQDSDLPFIVVQLADMDGCGEGWPAMQEAQLRVQNLSDRVKTVISRDVCESFDIHPPTKLVLAQRIAKVILEKQI